MNYFGRIVSGIKDYYSEINSATLTGAIDVLVVRQADGSFVGSPFHVRFGKIGVLRSREKVVDISINDEPVDLQMKLGEAGEAFFVEPCEEADVPHYLCTSPIPDVESLMSEGIQKMKQEIQESEQRCDIDSQAESCIELGSAKSIPESSKHSRDSDNDSVGDNDISIGQDDGTNLDTQDGATFVKRSANISVPGKRDSNRSIDQKYNASHQLLNEYYPLSDLDSPITSPRRTSPVQSPSPERYLSDTEINYQSEPDHRKENNRNEITWNWGSLPQGIDAKPSIERKQLSQLKKESKKPKHKSSTGHKIVAQGMYLDDLESVDREVANLYLQQAGHHEPNSVSSKGDNENKSDVDPIKSDVDPIKSDVDPIKSDVDPIKSDVDPIKSDVDPIKSDVDPIKSDVDPIKSDVDPIKSDVDPIKSDIDSIKSDVDPIKSDVDPIKSDVDPIKSDVDPIKSDIDPIKSDIDPMKSDVDPIKSDVDPIKSEVDPIKSEVDPIKSDSEVNKSDGESGLGSSLPVSPDETNIGESEPYSHIAMSLCGDLRRGKVSLERFAESMISFEDFSKDPSQILSDPKLVVQIDERYYNWNVAVPMLISHVVYQRPLNKTSVDALMKEHMPKKSKRRGWFASWRSPPEHNESTDEDCQEAEREHWANDNMHEEGENDNPDGISPEPLQQIPETSVEIEMTSESSTETYKKVLELSSEQLASLNLKDGGNEVTFSVTTKYQGTASCTASIFLYSYNDKIIISDIDGTITKSDVLGQILPASFWAQLGVTKLFSTVQKNGYKFMYLSARAIGQAELTRQHLKNVVQENLGLPSGPMFLSPSSLIKAFHREIIEKKPEEFKIQCLRNIKTLFPPKSDPFFAGFGNKINDVLSYRAVGIPVQRIFTINHKGEVKNDLTNAFQSSYTEMQDLVDQMFPPFMGYASLVAADEFSMFTYWRTPVMPLHGDEQLPITSSTLVTQTSL